MPHRTYAALLLIATFVLPLSAAADVTTGLIGHWKFDEGTGVVAADSVATNTASLIGNPAWIPTAVLGKAISFNGTTQYAKLATSSSSALNVGTGDFTVAGWVKINAGADQHNAFIAKDIAFSSAAYSGYFLGELYGQIRFMLMSKEGVSVSALTSATPYRGAWHHYAGVRQGDYIKLYIDGILVATSTLAGNYTTSFNVDNGIPLTVGTAYSFKTNWNLDGAVDDVRVYKRGLLAGEIAELSRFEKRALFPLFDQLGYAKKPDLLALGFAPMSIVGGAITLTEEDARNWARTAIKGRALVIDIEPEDGLTDANIAKLTQVVDWMHNENPELKIGFYDGAPIRNYWDPVLYAAHPEIASYRDKYNAWEARNAALRAFAAHSDFVTADLYSFYDDQPGWQVYARENLAQAFQYGKPIYAYIWPRFHNGGQHKDFHFLPGDYWRMELDFLKAHGLDGLVLWDWGGFAAPAPNILDTAQPWYVQTIDFISKNAALSVPSRKFTIGQRVTVSDSATAYAAKDGSTSVGTQPAGMGGVVTMGTDIFSGTSRWHIDFDSGVDGWADETQLAVEPPFKGLLARWDFEEASGKAKDSTLHNYTAFPVFAPVRVAGKIGTKAMSFNGTTQYLNAGNQTAFNFGAGDFTIAAWVKTDDAASQHKAFVAKNIASQNAYPGYFLGQYYGKVRFMLESAEGGTPAFAQATSTLQIGGWHHYAGVREGDSIKLYIDGMLAATSTLAGKYATSFNVDNGSPLTIGTAYSFMTNWMMNGSVDDARVYSMALSGEDVAHLFNPLIPMPPTPLTPSIPTPAPTPSTPTPTSAPIVASGGGGGGGSYIPFVSSATPPIASAPLSAAQRTSLIAELLAKVLELQKQIIALGGTPIAIPAGLSGGASTPPAVAGASSFTRNLKRGDRGEDVRALQRFLNTHGFVVAVSGDGSAGRETDYFGPGTVSALIRFQNAYKSDILAPAGLSAGSGFFGTLTRGKVADLADR